MSGAERYYRSFSSYVREQFGAPVRRVCVNAGFSCPNLDGTLSREGCAYCNNATFSPVACVNTPLESQIAEGICRARQKYGAQMFLVYFQPYTNTYGPADRLKEACDTALRFPEVVGIIVGTRPDCVDDEKLDILASYLPRYEVWVEYGLQSIHEKTLRLINRNHTYRDFLAAAKASAQRGLKVCCHLIIGLPGEGREEIVATAQEVGRAGIDGVKIHPLYVAKGTTLEQWYRQGTCRPLDRSFYTQAVCDSLECLPPQTVVHRLTADCPAHLLVAPDWIRDKRSLLAEIHAAFSLRGTRQGHRYLRGNG